MCALFSLTYLRVQILLSNAHYYKSSVITWFWSAFLFGISSWFNYYLLTLWLLSRDNWEDQDSNLMLAAPVGLEIALSLLDKHLFLIFNLGHRGERSNGHVRPRCLRFLLAGSAAPNWLSTQNCAPVVARIAKAATFFAVGRPHAIH